MPDDKLPDDIIAATSPEPKNVPEVLERLKAIHSTLVKKQVAADQDPSDLSVAHAYLAARHDGLACFNHLYRVITAEINEKIEKGDYFRDNEFLTQFDVEFAKRYLSAIRKYADPSANGPAPACWQVLFENRENLKISPMKFAISGIACHVCLDLPIALVSTCKDRRKSLNAHTHDDFQKINLIFYEKIPRLRRHFEDTSERAFDHSIIKRLANQISDFTVSFTRDIAWQHGMELWGAWSSSARLAKKEHDLDNRTYYIARGVLWYL
jgi:Family of unknown function (DUF5995)